MGSSLRLRVLVWYTALLAGVIVAFGAIVCLLSWRGRLAEIDADLQARAASLTGAIVRVGDGTFDLTLPPEFAESGADPAWYYAIWRPDGHVLDRSDPDVSQMPASLGVRTQSGARELSVRAASGPTVLVGRSLEDAYAESSLLVLRLAGAGLAAVGLAFAGGWWLVGRALRPIARISDTARAMTEGDFTARIPPAQVASELGQLARSLNEAFDRLHAALERQQRFTADASHELRTPLTTMSTELQWALGADRRPAEHVESLDVCRRSVDRMTAIVNRLLVLARDSAGADAHRSEPVRIDEVAAGVIRDTSRLAAHRQVGLRISAVPAVVMGDAGRLVEALTNVVVNAIQYNRESGVVTMEVRQSGGEVTVDVHDTGIGIPPAECERVFEPFYRADSARSRDAGGAGLGLAVTRALIARHGGQISCTSEPGAGTTISIRLPARAAGQTQG
jgi:signal transduction histidine kinase